MASVLVFYLELRVHTSYTTQFEYVILLFLKQIEIMHGQYLGA